MEPSLQQQIFEQIKSAKKILIALPAQLDIDTVSSGLALFLFLRKLEKEVEIVSAGAVPSVLQFLPEVAEIKTEIQSKKSLVVVLDISRKALDEISYQVGTNKVDIFLKPKKEIFTPEDITISTDKFPTDLIIVLGCKSLESLGKVFEQNTDLFFETPKINIDHQSGNVQFGSVNAVDLTATSVAEILYHLFSQFESQMVEAEIATCLLAGIIAKTNSFQRIQTTPKAFLAASELIGLGGRQQEVVKNIYKTRSLPLLKLWGRALARLQINEQHKTAYSILNHTDFEKAGALDQDMALVLQELLENIQGQNLVALFCENSAEDIKVLLAFRSEIDRNQFLQSFGGHAQSEIGSLPPYTLVETTLPEMSLSESEAQFLKALEHLPSTEV